MRRFCSFLLAGLLALAVGPAARATLTDPVLGLSAARQVLGSMHSHLAFDGTFPFEDLIQLPVPLQILVFDPATGDYLRMDLASGAFGGTSADLMDGLDAADVPALVASGAPDPDVALVGARPGRIELRASPQGLPAGSLAQLFFVDDDGPVLSNAVPLGVEP